MKWVFCDSRVLVKKLASSFGHLTKVSTQVQLASTWDYLAVRLTRALGTIFALHSELMIIVLTYNTIHCFNWQYGRVLPRSFCTQVVITDAGYPSPVRDYQKVQSKSQCAADPLLFRSRTQFEFGPTQIIKSTPVDVEFNSPNLIWFEPAKRKLLVKYVITEAYHWSWVMHEIWYMKSSKFPAEIGWKNGWAVPNSNSLS